MIDILTDSTSDLSPELLERYHIQRVPLSVFVDGKDLKDGDLSLAQLFDAVKRTGELPKTSAVPVAEFQQVFGSPNDVIYISLSSQLSATHQNAVLAAAEVQGKRIAVIDSLNLSTGIGLLVLKAAQLRDQGASFDEIVQQVQLLIPKVHTSFVIDTMEYLYKGGRCSALANIFGTLLRIRPVIEVRKDGSMGVKEKIGGARKRALLSMLDEFKTLLPGVDQERVFITHTGCDADAEFLKTTLLSIANIQEVHITYAGTTIASHCGPGTIGILYLTK
jgi:DegV family protein with EDD domain